MILLRLTPNWKDRVTETLKFQTSIFITDNGKEVRHAKMSRPAWSFEFTTLLDPVELRKLTNYFTATRQREFLFRVPTMKITLTLAKDPITDLFRCVVPSWLFVGAYITYDKSVWEVVTIESNGFRAQPRFSGIEQPSADGTIITAETGEGLTTEDGFLWLAMEGAISQRVPAGQSVYMAMLGRFRPSLNVPFVTGKIAKPKIIIDASYKYPLRYVGPVVETYLTDHIAPFVPNWREGVKHTLNTFREEFASNTGPLAYSWRTDHTARSWGMTSTFFTREKVHDFAAFFCDKYGKARTFWFESPTRELELSQYYPSNLFVVLKDMDSAIGLPNDSTARYLVLKLANKTKIIRRITNIIKQPENNTVRVVTDVAFPVLTSEIIAVTVMFQSRFTDDEISIEWHSDEVAEVDIGIITHDYEA